MKNKIVFFNFLIGTGIIFLISGCSNAKPVASKISLRKDILTKPYQIKITPIIGTRQDDAKVIMDMGKVMKVWIAPYKNNSTFVSSHDNFVVAKKPEFVVGETVPQKNWRSMKTPVNEVPFLFRNADMDTANNLSNREVVDFNNNVYKQQNDVNVAKKRLKADSKYDQEIKNFLNYKK